MKTSPSIKQAIANLNQPLFAEVVTLGEAKLLCYLPRSEYLLEICGVNQTVTLAESFRWFSDGMKDCMPMVTGDGFTDWLDDVARRLERTA